MSKQSQTPLTERKVVRRGLLAGLAGLGAAAMLKVTGADKASAATGDHLVLGNLNPVTDPPGQEFEDGTRINYTTGASNVFAFDVRHGNLAISQALGGGHAIQGSNNNISAAIFGRNHSTGPGVGAVSRSGPGVQGAAGLEGVRGIGTSNGVGVIGASNTGLLSTPDGTGNGIGVHGKSTGGPGVQGNSVNSLGVRGISTNFVGVRRHLYQQPRPIRLYQQPANGVRHRRRRTSARTDLGLLLPGSAIAGLRRSAGLRRPRTP